jgi:hypothetical protein
MLFAAVPFSQKERCYMLFNCARLLKVIKKLNLPPPPTPITLPYLFIPTMEKYEFFSKILGMFV